MDRRGLVGKKIGMTQIFEGGKRIPVTVVELGPNTVVQKKSKDGKDGYDAVQLGFADKAHKKVNKPLQGHFTRADVKPKWRLRELRLSSEAVAALEVGQDLKAEDIFQEGEWIDVTATSKGRGFQGVVRRHNMKGAKQATHGTHEQFRHVGSIGCRTTPGEVHKGKRLPGQMGNKKVTVQNLRIAKIDAENNLVLVYGSVPGPRNGFVMIHQAVKKHGKVTPLA